MTLTERINNDIKAAMLARDKDKLEALRAIKAALLLAGTSGESASEDSEFKMLQKLVKQRKEAAAIYEQNGRKELAEAELLQVGYIEVYLPQMMGADDIRSAIRGIIADSGASGIKDMGKVMGAAAKLLAGKADNKMVSEIVKELLS